MSATRPCDSYQDELAELALGTLTGRERAETLGHIETCGRCAAEVEELSRAADELLQVACEAEPPVGFEVRLLERLGVDPGRRRRPRRVHIGRVAHGRGSAGRHRPALLAAATVAIAAAGFSIGLAEPWAHTTAPATSKAPSGIVTEAALRGANGEALGRVIRSAGTAGSPAWLFMVVETDHRAGKLTCEIELTNGSTITLGSFWMESGYGTWSSALPASAANIAGARLVGDNGATVATATFSTSA